MSKRDMGKDEKLDLQKLHKAEYAATRKPGLVEVKKAQYLAVCGQGAPGGKVFTSRVGALYGAAYTIKMTRKFAGKGDYVICKLEGQWWSDDNQCDFKDVALDEWRWRLLIRTPDFIKKKDLDEALAKLLEKDKGDEVKEVALISFAEGTCAQMLHVGPYDKEHETLARMRDMIETKGLEVHGRHHEIYLSDPRRVAPEKLRTILRVPVKKKQR